MSNAINPSDNQSSYVINPEEAAETTRLLLLDRIVTQEMGGVFPDGFTPPAGHLILDLACGPGGWALDVATAYQELDIIGVDISARMIRYAQAQAGLLARTNASFQVMDILKPLAFPDETFLFVNARFISGFMAKEAWPSLVQECLRVLLPGGVLRLTDAEFAFTNGQACEQIAEWGIRAMEVDGKTFSPNGKRSGITLQLAHFLREAGCEEIRHRGYALEFSFGTAAHDPWSHNVLLAYQLMLPFLLQKGVTTQQHFERLYEHMREEVQDPAFLGLHFFRSAWGIKPGAGETP